MDRLELMWSRLKGERRRGLIPFLTGGDPGLEATRRLIPVLEESGADLIEIGVPFSDPMADGPVIQRASERALRRGVTLAKILKIVRQVRRESQVPILLMGYYNPILSYGLARYARDLARAGVDATLVVDLPPEEALPLRKELRKRHIHLIYLLTPTSDPERIRKVVSSGTGFIYFVSMTGVTGGRGQKSFFLLKRKLEEIRRKTRLPIVIGFGIRTPKEAVRFSRMVDGVVVGSELVRRIAQSQRPQRAAERFLLSLRRGLDRGFKTVAADGGF